MVKVAVVEINVVSVSKPMMTVDIVTVVSWLTVGKEVFSIFADQVRAFIPFRPV